MNKRILIPKVKNKKDETITTRQGIAHVSLNSTKACTIPEFTKKEVQDAVDRLKRGKAKNSGRVRAEQLKNCSDSTKKKKRSSMKSHDRKISHREVGEKSEYRSSTKKVTEKMQAISGQSAACQCYTNYLPRYYMHVSLHLCTKYNLLTKVGSGLMVYRVLEQRCREWGVPLYISTIDFTKAFDRIKH